MHNLQLIHQGAMREGRWWKSRTQQRETGGGTRLTVYCSFSYLPAEGDVDSKWSLEPSTEEEKMIPVCAFSWCSENYARLIGFLEVSGSVVFVCSWCWHPFKWSEAEHSCLVKNVKPLQSRAGQGAGRSTVDAPSQRASVNGIAPLVCWHL